MGWEIGIPLHYITRKEKKNSLSISPYRTLCSLIVFNIMATSTTGQNGPILCFDWVGIRGANSGFLVHSVVSTVFHKKNVVFLCPFI